MVDANKLNKVRNKKKKEKLKKEKLKQQQQQQQQQQQKVYEKEDGADESRLLGNRNDMSEQNSPLLRPVDEASTISFSVDDLDEPFIKKELKLKYERILDPLDPDFSQIVADGCKKLLNEIPKGLDESFKVELLLDTQLMEWNLQVTLDPNEWFYLKYNDSWDKKQKVLKQAQNYIDNAIKTDRLTSDAEKITSKSEKAATGFCGKHGCKGLTKHLIPNTNTYKKCSFQHVGFQCKENIAYKGNDKENKTGKPCDLTISKESMWTTFDVNNKGKWILSSRWQELTREILIMPDEDLVKNKIIPHGNKGCIQVEQFWNYIQYACDEINNLKLIEEGIPITDRVIINFGKWETGMRLSIQLAECHAHAHIWLSLPFVRAIQTQDLKSKGQKAIKLQELLKDHINRPQDYLKSNSEELQVKILPKQLELSNDNYGKLDDKLKKLDDKLKKLDSLLELLLQNKK